MPDWSIKIVSASSGGGAAFQPDLQGYSQGDPLPAQQDDLVSWNNTTDDTHQPWPTDSNYNPLSEADVLPRGSANYLSDPIPAGESSRPSYDVAQPDDSPQTWIVYYFCKLHPTLENRAGLDRSHDTNIRLRWLARHFQARRIGDFRSAEVKLSATQKARDCYADE